MDEAACLSCVGNSGRWWDGGRVTAGLVIDGGMDGISGLVR